MTRALGFDIGGSTIRGGLLELDGARWTIRAQHKLLLSRGTKGPDEVMDAFVDVAESLLAEVGEATAAAQIDLPIGAGLPGSVTVDGRHVTVAPNLGWNDAPVADLIEARLPRARVHFDNDLNVILLGEHRFGTAQGVRDVVAIYPGTGIGGAVLVDGRIVRGSRGFAGEIGHITVGGDRECGCGKIGCTETIAGGGHIEARVAEDRAAGRLGSAYDDLASVRVNDIDRAFLAGDSYAVTLWNEVVEVLAVLGATACALLNPELVLLGGGLIQHAPALAEQLAKAILARTPAALRDGLRVERGQLGEEAGILGAAALALSGAP